MCFFKELFQAFSILGVKFKNGQLTTGQLHMLQIEMSVCRKTPVSIIVNFHGQAAPIALWKIPIFGWNIKT